MPCGRACHVGSRSDEQSPTKTAVLLRQQRQGSQTYFPILILRHPQDRHANLNPRALIRVAEGPHVGDERPNVRAYGCLT